MIKRYLQVDPGKDPKVRKAGTSKLKKTPFLPHPKSKGQEVVMAATGKQTKTFATPSEISDACFCGFLQNCE